MQHLETKLTTDLRRLGTAIANHADDIATLTKCVSEPETRPTPDSRSTPTAATTSGWLQNHVILGGLSEKTTTEDRIATIQNALSNTPALADQALRPFAPRGSTIVKTQLASETIARQGHARLQKQLQTLSTHRPDLTGTLGSGPLSNAHPHTPWWAPTPQPASGQTSPQGPSC